MALKAKLRLLAALAGIRTPAKPRTGPSLASMWHGGESIESMRQQARR